MPLNEVSSHFDPILPHLKCYHATLEENATPLTAALGFGLCMEEVDVVLCGVIKEHQLKELIEVAQKPRKLTDQESFQLEQVAFLNPSNWKLN